MRIVNRGDYAMVVAVTIWNGRVSPVFDTASRLVLVEFDGDKQGEPVEYPVLEGGPAARVDLMTGLGVSTLICGGISSRTAMLVERAGITLVPWISGNIEEVLEAFGNGILGEDGFQMPGCGQGRRRRYGGRGGGCQGMGGTGQEGRGAGGRGTGRRRNRQ